MKIQENISLRLFNTFGIDVSCQWFAEVNSEVEAWEAIQFGHEKNLPILILGGGSNLLFTRHLNCLILKVNLKGIQERIMDDTSIEIEAAAGENWHELVLYAVERNWGGIENLSLIPGCVGAAPIQNIGAYGTEIKEVLIAVKLMELETGKIFWINNEDCRFGYRDSIFKREWAGKNLVLAVKLKLSRNPVPNISYSALANELSKSGKEKFTIREVSDAVIRVRKSKLPDPQEIGNAGSFFKNPEIPDVKFELLRQNHPAIPSFDSSPGMKKVPAAWLIDQAGWKGRRFGNYGVHKDQPLVLVNYGGASGHEILNLSDEIQKSVLQKFGVTLEREVNVV